MKCPVPTVRPVDVPVVAWPTEQQRRHDLRDEGRPRLLLVEPDAPAPVISDPLEDWIRLPAVDGDLEARINGLRLRMSAVEPEEAEPTIDADGIFRAGSSWVAVPPIEARLVRALLTKIGAVVSREALLRAGWPDGHPSRNVLDVHILRLRRRIAPTEVAIRTVRSRGYVLEF